jgi:hypothetical protein
MLDIFAGYTIDFISGVFLYLFFNNEKLKFNEYLVFHKKRVRNLSYLIILVIAVSIFFFGGE